MAIKDIVKGICNISRCKYDVYTKEKIDEMLIGTVLYQNAEGSNTITWLNDDVSNYKYIEVLYGSSGLSMTSSKVDTTLTNYIDTNIIHTSDANNTYILNTRWLLNGRQIEPATGGQLRIQNYNGDIVITTDFKGRGIYILKVIGYKQ